MNNDNQDKPESRVNDKKRGNNNNNQSHNSLLKMGIVAFISAALGVVVAFAGFTYFGNNSSDTASVGNTAGTTQVSNTKVNTSSSMSGAYKKVNGAVVSVINLQSNRSNLVTEIFHQFLVICLVTVDHHLTVPKVKLMIIAVAIAILTQIQILQIQVPIVIYKNTAKVLV